MRRPTARPVPAVAAAAARREAAIDALAEALAATGRGEPVRAIEALAAVVINRIEAARARRAPPWWGVDLLSAVRAPGLFPPRDEAPAAQALACACRRIAARAAAGTLPDPTGGALFWHRWGEEPPPDAPEGKALRLGGLVFIRPDDPPAPAGEPGWTPAGQG